MLHCRLPGQPSDDDSHLALAEVHLLAALRRPLMEPPQSADGIDSWGVDLVVCWPSPCVRCCKCAIATNGDAAWMQQRATTR